MSVVAWVFAKGFAVIPVDDNERFLQQAPCAQSVDKFAQAAATYQNNPVALHLRGMNMLYEAVKERGAMVIVPSSVVETMGLGGTLATAALGGAKP